MDADTDKRRVLLVEGKSRVGVPYKTGLSKAGFVVHATHKMADALLQAETNNFDVLISDHRVPGMNGIELVRRLRQRSINLPVVLLLDKPDNEAVLDASELGVFECLVKPITLEVLKKTASRAHLRHRLQAFVGAGVSLPSSADRRPRFTATEAKNGFGQILDKAIQGNTIVITKHNLPRAVLMSMEEFTALSGASESQINTLTAEFDSLLARMQGSTARSAMEAAFRASPERLGKAALAADRTRG
jgi:antitoxin Phd